MRHPKSCLGWGTFQNSLPLCLVNEVSYKTTDVVTVEAQLDQSGRAQTPREWGETLRGCSGWAPGSGSPCREGQGPQRGCSAAHRTQQHCRHQESPELGPSPSGHLVRVDPPLPSVHSGAETRVKTIPKWNVTLQSSCWLLEWPRNVHGSNQFVFPFLKLNTQCPQMESGCLTDVPSSHSQI